MDKRISVLCVDDHQIVREGIVAVIGRQSDMEVTGTAANGLQAVEAFLQNPPDVTLMDLQLPVLSGLEAIRRIRVGRRARQDHRADDVSRRRGRASGARQQAPPPTC